MEELELLHKLVWKNSTRFFWLGLLLAAGVVLSANPELAVTNELAVDFMLTYTGLRFITGLMVSAVEMALIIFLRKN